MKLSQDVIARAALTAINEVGLNGLTMRVVAGELGVAASALYGHVKHKQALIDAMATLLFVEATEYLEAPRHGVTWDDWMLGWLRNYRNTLLRYRDGARVVAGTFVAHPSLFRWSELVLRTMQDAGIPPAAAARHMMIPLDFTIGFVIEEQARTGVDYPDGNPYRYGQPMVDLDAERYPLLADLETRGRVDYSDASFTRAIGTILRGIKAEITIELQAGRGDSHPDE
ncbi:TetR family transcriptional regulator [Pseudonocardiaceae bacterium YIM PH 21723]|nr:TetR family transcriptional regulator [Pseudonocardiaceae bacterium YIM PH 21723]